MISYFQTLIHFINSEKDIVKFPAGQRLYAKGENGFCMYLIKKGCVKVSIGGTLIEIGGEGSVLGEESLLEGLPRMANATAVTDCVIVPIDNRRLSILTKMWPDIFQQLQVSMTNRRKIVEIGLGSAQG